MRKLQPRNNGEIKDLVSYLGGCHDASIKKISFVKDRHFTANGDLAWSHDPADLSNAKCTIVVELLLNSYTGAKKDQVVVLEFGEVMSFTFVQDADFDYSDVYEVSLEQLKDQQVRFVFFCTEKRVKAISGLCRAVVCKEL